jgi:hypothetical protein
MPVAKFIVPDWGDIVHPYAGVNFIPTVRDYEFGYRPQLTFSAAYSENSAFSVKI